MPYAGFANDLVQEAYRPNRSLVHKSLLEDTDFYDADGIGITVLAVLCLNLKKQGVAKNEGHC